MALGAAPREILALVARRGLVLGGLGVVAGGWIAYAAGRWLESLLAGTSPADPLTFTAAAAFAFAMTVGGCMVPAIRASRIDPKQAMEAE